MYKYVENESDYWNIQKLKRIIANLMPQSRSHLIVIKTLLENNFRATKKILIQELEFYNKDHPNKDTKSIVFSDLENKLIISKYKNEYLLKFESNDAFDVLDAISLCNQKLYHEKTKLITNYFIAVGSWNSWEHTIKNPPLQWRINKEVITKSPEIYNKISEGDVVFYYATKRKPIHFTETGFFGIGAVKSKSITREEYWPEKKEAGKAMFTHKVFLDTIKFSQTESELISVSDGLPLRNNFNHIDPGEPLNELLKNAKLQFGVSKPKEKSPSGITPEKFEALIKMFDKERTIFYEHTNWKYYDKQRGEQREEFVSKFPIDKIQDITIERYVLGLHDKTGRPRKPSFSYLLEFKTHAYGSIRGGTARKFGMYYSQKRKEFWYPKDKYVDSKEAFEVILKQIQKIIDAGKDFVKEHNVQKLSNIIDGEQYIIYPAIRAKILAVYFCNTFLTIHTEKHLDDMLDHFKIPRGHLKGKRTQKQLKLIEQKNKHPIMKNWSVENYSHFLWNALCTHCHTHIEIPPESTELHLPPINELENIKESIQKDLLIDGGTIDRIIASLYAGRNVLLTGPVGTGKTDLAQRIPKGLDYYPEVYTATSDWTTQDVIGGIFPKVENGNAVFRIQKGCVTHTVSKNWDDGTGLARVRIPYSKPNSKTDKVYSYKGVWLIIDEFNRANIDRAFGQLFTALEHRNQLKVPTDVTGEDFQTFVIPDDYRIIGTLNAHDRHFLFNLSDALKRRFDFIEVSIPPRDPENKEIHMVREKAATGNELSNGIHELDESDERTDNKLYEIMSFIRKSKQLGTALLISMFKDMLVYHQMGQDWNSSLDSALAKTIIPQIEDISVSALVSIKLFVSGDMASFFVRFSHHDHSEKTEDYIKELEKYKEYYHERFGEKFSKDWVDEFKERNLSKLYDGQDPEQGKDYKSIMEELNPWTSELKRPALPLFRKSLDSLIAEKEFSSVNVIEFGQS